MTFTRYEIREFYEDGDFTYIPFDYKEQAIKYIMEHTNCSGWLCKITLGSNWDSCERLSTCDEVRKQHH